MFSPSKVFCYTVDKPQEYSWFCQLLLLKNNFGNQTSFHKSIRFHFQYNFISLVHIRIVCNHSVHKRCENNVTFYCQGATSLQEIVSLLHDIDISREIRDRLLLYLSSYHNIEALSCKTLGALAKYHSLAVSR